MRAGAPVRSYKGSQSAPLENPFGGGCRAFPPDTVAHLLRTRPCGGTEEPGGENDYSSQPDRNAASRSKDAPARARPRPVAPGTVHGSHGPDR